MEQKQSINSNYRLMVQTQLFLTLDMYIISSEQEKSELFYDILTEKLFNNTQDIELYNYYYNPSKLYDIVTDLKTQKIENLINTGYKKYIQININTINNVYNMSIPENINHLFIIQIKKFDKDNYIVPITLYIDNQYIINNDHKLNLNKLFQEKNIDNNLMSLLNNFKKAIFI